MVAYSFSMDEISFYLWGYFWLFLSLLFVPATLSSDVYFLIFVVWIFLLVILICKVIISVLRIAVLSVDAVSLYQSFRMDCRDICPGVGAPHFFWMMVDSGYLGAILTLWLTCLCLVKTLSRRGWGGVEVGKVVSLSSCARCIPCQINHDPRSLRL